MGQSRIRLIWYWLGTYYLAHEYLTKATIYGQQWDPAGAEEERSEDGEQEAEPNKGNHKRYVEVSSLLKAEGAHLPGVVN
ncbi:hypothetical protein P3X46_017811 [Hevea brasiliensis]|uniref:Uncharacterized protein n=1 Tax=Hevea brasiliensis TaxID=3981 RepID=A0ABQ9LRZ4_HEVBR|nr:hypothetical protein P3X46_017811 [Hevea brasiliensis]